MFRIHFTRALIVLTLIASLAALPAAAQAAARADDHGVDRAGSVSVLGSLIDWVTSIWGAGGSDADPSGSKLTANPPRPEEPSTTPIVERTAPETGDGG